jgi:hypothetical protein
MATIAELVERCRSASVALADVAEGVAEEWQYVADLQAAWAPALEALAATHGLYDAEPEVVAAIDRLIDEVGRITDPHRAIDWLSTFPQAAVLALGDS